MLPNLKTPLYCFFHPRLKSNKHYSNQSPTILRMRYFLALFSIAIISFLLTLFLPWWLMPVTAYLVAFFIGLRPGRAFSAGFLGIALLWLLLLVVTDISNHGLLSKRMAGVFFLPHRFLFLAVNILVGGLIGGLAAWSGALLRRYFWAKKAIAIN